MVGIPKGAALDRLDQAWVADITYIRLPTAFVRASSIWPASIWPASADAFSRRCIGWKLSRQIDTQLTLAALEMAIERRQPHLGLIHHSDRGVQYASSAYVSGGDREDGGAGEHVGDGQSLRHRQSRELLGRP
jgi:putative transposase